MSSNYSGILDSFEETTVCAQKADGPKKRYLLAIPKFVTDLFSSFSVSSLLWAAGRGHYEIVQLLIDNNVKIDIGDKVKFKKSILL
jgi:ankyrin repeat protein